MRQLPGLARWCGPLALVALATSAVFAQTGTGEHWIATWGTAQTLTAAGGGRGAAPNPEPPASPAPAAAPAGPQRRFQYSPPVPSVNNQTIRMIVRTSAAGTRLRVRISNALGATTVPLGGAHVAIREANSSILPASDRQLMFSGKPTATLYAGQTLLSDPVNLAIPALSDVAVSLYFPGPTNLQTLHRGGWHSTYISPEGDFTARSAIVNPTTVVQSYYFLAGLDVLAPADAATLVTFGDSITDGSESTPDQNGMWPAVLAVRLQAAKQTAHIGVVNAGIGGNRMLGGNNGGLVRLAHDALDQPGIKWLMLLEGINDITGGASTEDLIAAYRQVIETAHLYGIKIIGCTMNPTGGSSIWTSAREEVRVAANNWIRTSGAFDAVVDFDAVMRDPADPKHYRIEADSSDMVHPGDAGYKLMANAVDLSIFATGSGTPKRNVKR